MKGPFLPRYFFASALLLLVLASIYVFTESQRLRQELLRQTEAKGAALAEAMETSAKNAILGNSLLEDLVSQRLLDNARLIDQLLMVRPVDQGWLQMVSGMNRLQKIELLDPEGRPVKFPLPFFMIKEMREMMARMHEGLPQERMLRRHQMTVYMWGRRWALPGEKENTPAEPSPHFKEQKFWEGSLFGVAIQAQSFPGIIAVHANADYILNFKKEIGVQRQIEDLGRQADIEYVALLDNKFTVVAHTSPILVGEQEQDAFIVKARAAGGESLTRVLRSGGVPARYELVKPLRVNDSPLGYLKIGLSLAPAEAAWRNSLWSIIVLGLAILALGIMGMAAIFYNQNSHIRQIEKLEAEVSRQERLSQLGNLAATVAHEIRNPLNSISIGLQRLKAEFRPTEDQEQYLRFIELMRGEVQRLNSIVEEFLSLARPLELKPEAVKVEEVLQELALLAANDADPAKVRIQVVTPDPLPPLRADRNYLKQLLLNLILNGIQAMPDGGTLTLEARPSSDGLVLGVADTGIGMPPEVLERVFEPYFTTKSNGSGLGLAIARRIAEAHGGTIEIKSHPGQGSRFQITLPLGGPQD
jgi:signal transduction histidine kinase